MPTGGVTSMWILLPLGEVAQGEIQNERGLGSFLRNLRLEISLGKGQDHDRRYGHRDVFREAIPAIGPLVEKKNKTC